MGAQGTATIDFGAFPGKSDASVAVTGQTLILSDSLCDAWLYPTATADHSADEHLVEALKVFAGNVVAGTGFTIYAFSDNRLSEALEAPGIGRVHRAHATAGANILQQPTVVGSVGGKLPMIYGQWTVAWVWN